MIHPLIDQMFSIRPLPIISLIFATFNSVGQLLLILLFISIGVPLFQTFFVTHSSVLPFLSLFLSLSLPLFLSLSFSLFLFDLSLLLHTLY